MLFLGPMRGSTTGFSPAASDCGVSTKKTRKRLISILQECGYFDVHHVQEISWALLYTLGAACVERTSGDPFNYPSMVVDDVKKEMLDYVQQQVDAYATGSNSNQLLDSTKVVQDFLQNYIKSKRSLFRRVSSKILFNEKQDDKIKEFVHDLDRTGGWMAGQREAFAKAYLKRVDRSRMNHCAIRFESGQQLAQHKNKCPYWPLMCDNDGCGEAY